MKIQALWRMYKTRQWYIMISQLRVQACLKIQHNWRLIKFLRVGPKIMREKRFNAAQMIQKYLRGYLQKKHFEKEIAIEKLEQTQQFF